MSLKSGTFLEQKLADKRLTKTLTDRKYKNDLIWSCYHSVKVRLSHLCKYSAIIAHPVHSQENMYRYGDTPHSVSKKRANFSGLYLQGAR